MSATGHMVPTEAPRINVRKTRGLAEVGCVRIAGGKIGNE